MHIKELVLQTASLKRTKLFYHKTLELEILNEGEDSISFKAGKSKLTFKEVQDEKPYYHIAFNIVNNKFSDSYEWINNKLDILPVDATGMTVAGYDNWNAQSFYFYDNNGSVIEFIVRFDLPYQSKEPFSSDCITEISEAGLVSNDVAGLAKEINEQYGIPYFSKGPNLKDFVAMGDNHGLILVSQINRPWVPTNKPGQIFPMTIITENERPIQMG